MVGRPIGLPHGDERECDFLMKIKSLNMHCWGINWMPSSVRERERDTTVRSVASEKLYDKTIWYVTITVIVCTVEIKK